MPEYYSSPRVSSEYPDCSLPLTFDVYNICSFKCQYCFAYYQKSNNPSCKGVLNVKPVNIKSLIDIFDKKNINDWKWKCFIKYGIPIHFGGLADNYDNNEKQIMAGYPLVKKLAEIKYPTIFSTKGTLMAEGKYYQLFKDYKDNKNFAFQFSIITNSDKNANVIERGCPSTSERLYAMKKISDLGYWAILRLRPYIIGLTNVDIESLIERSAQAGAKAVSMEFFCLERRMSGEKIEKRYEILSKVIGFNIVKYYQNLSPTERGTYQRLNRDVKEKYVKQIWKLCKKHNLQFNISDPDFKELNQSGSCCGLPDNANEYIDKCLTSGWSRAQLTHHLRLLRERYWKSNGKDKYLTFDDILNSEKAEWMNNMKVYTHSLKRWATRYDMRDTVYKEEFLQTWNNLRSPGNPYNYFHGKIKPAFLDSNKNIVYEYIPSKYEIEWAKEGLL